MANDRIASDGYRLNVGMVISNQQGQLFWGCRADCDDTWQFPQGGIHEGEDVLAAMYRELEEEVGLLPQHVTVIASTREWLIYDFPPSIQKQLNPAVRGQRQRWFLLRLDAADTCINVTKSGAAEFSQWRWVSYWQPLEEIVFFKRDVYQALLKEFAKFI